MPPSQRITVGTLRCRLNSARSAKSQVRKRRRSVSATVSAIERSHRADERVDAIVDMLEVGTKAEDRAADVIGPVDPCAAEHHSPFLLEMLEQPFVEAVGVTALRFEGEGDDREIGRRARIPAVELG